MSSVGSDDERAGGRYRSGSEGSDAAAKEASSSRRRDEGRPDKGKAKSRRRHSDEEDEDEGSEEEEESDEEDDEEEGGRRKRKRRRQGGNRFLDVEAEVDDDEEEFEEEDADFGKEDGFIEADVDSATGDDAVRRREAADHQRLDRMRREQEDRTAEEVAAELNQRYRRTTVTGRSEYSEIPQRMLMPSVQDPSLYSVRCKAGREKEIVMTMMRRVFKLAEQGKDTGLISCFFRDSLPSRVYMEARSSKDIVEACLEVTGVYARSQDQLFLVPIDEMADLLRITKVTQEIKPGSWVRIKRGRYAGDLASVTGINQTGEIVDVRFVPRIDMNPRAEGEFTDVHGRKRKKGVPSGAGGTIKDRPPAKFFNYDEICRVMPNRERPILRAGKYEYKGDNYINGYCEKELRSTMLITENVNPTLDEIARFMGDSSGEGEGFDRAGLESLAQATKAKADVVLRSGDQVEVFEGEQAGIHGVAHTVGVDVISLRIDVGEKTEQVIEVPVSAVHKRFMPGDHIKVMNGQHRDETGLVVKVERNVTTFISDLTLQEISVFSKDIHEAAEVGSGITTVGQYELHDLVQLDAQTAACIFKIERGNFLVLDQMGNVRTIQPHQITMKRDAHKAVALDADGGEFRKGDTMKEVDHEERDGQVLHVYQSMLVWLFNRDLRENDGVFMVRARQLRPKAPRSAMPLTDLSKQNPALQAVGAAIANAQSGGASSNMRRPTGRDEFVGKTVAITRGPYKTYRGIIKETNGPMARVELHTMSKILPVDISWLIEKDPITGASKPLIGRGAMGPPGAPGTVGSATPFTMSGSGSATPYGGSKTPAYGGSKTPAYGAGGKTPAYGAGGKTPAYGYNDGGKTPAYGYNDGGRTPAYGYNDGGRTPAYGGGGRTPAQGGRTPAYGAGNRTPAYGGSGANDGSRTPAYGALGSTSYQSVAASDGGSVSPNPWGNRRAAGTPLAPPSNPYGSAPTPMGAPTPGAYASAPTPAAATPGAPRAPYAAPTPGAATPATYGSAPTPGAAAAPTPGGSAWAPTPSTAWAEPPTPAAAWAHTPGALGAPTPGALSAPTPAANAAWSSGTSRAAAPLSTQLVPDILVHIVPDASGSFEGGKYDAQAGNTVAVSNDGRSAHVRLDSGAVLSEVPAQFVRPQRPDRRGAMCRLLRGVEQNPLGARVVVQTIDGDEVMAQSNTDGSQVFGKADIFALAA